MSLISSRKSLNSSILKSTASRNESLKKTKVRFSVNLSSVKSILKEVEENATAKSYQNLVYKLTEPELKEEDLFKIVSEMIEAVPMITKDHILLVQTLLNIRWIKRSNEIIELYHKLILSLMTSNHFLVHCLTKILGCFVPEDEDMEEWKNGVPSDAAAEKLQLVHNLLKRSLDVMPMIPVTLRKQIRVEFPYFKQPNFKIVAYISNLLKLLDYCPSMICDVLELIFENLVLLDVNVSREQIENSEDNDDEWQEVAVDEEADKMKLPIAETLDMCMEKILGYFNTKFTEDTEAARSDQQMMMETIFNYFDRQILRTYTKHVHFILFYIASLKKSFLTDFLNYLWCKISDRNQSATIRQTAIGYLSSFLSRARFLSQEVLKDYLNKLSNWVHAYVKTCDYSRNKNPKAHVVFYSVCQAIFYVIAFRSRELTRCDKNLEFLLRLDLWPIIKHPLNPLNVCLPAIATIFDNITTKYQILFCHTIIVSNASRSLTTVYANEQHRPEEVLESVFPFDPYLLKKSGKRIHPLYVEYQSEDGVENPINESAHSSPLGSTKRTRYESTSGDLEDFIIRENKIQKTY